MKTTHVGLAIAGLLSLLLACSKENKNSVPVRFLLTDNPIDYDSVNIHITGMRVKINDTAGGWIEVPTRDTTINLLDLQNGVTTQIAEGDVPDGILKEVRFILAEDNYVVVDGVRQELRTPSAQQSGLKIKIDRELDEDLNTFILDFDAALSVKEQNGRYMLEPVIKLKD